MIGQMRAKTLGNLAIVAGKNVLITGFSGHGKTMLANELKTPTYIQLLDSAPPQKALSWKLNKRIVSIICDEIHAAKSQITWAVFLDAFKGTVIFTTTNPERVIDAIRTRCQAIELAKYSETELAQISGLGGTNATVLAKICRGIPRKAKNLGDIFRVFPGSMKEFVLNVLEMSVYRNHLLYPEEILYIQILSDVQPVSEKVLRELVKFGNYDEVELGLRRLGLITITPRGRILNGET